MNPTSLSFCLSYSSTLTLMKLFLLPSGSISMHQREEPANTLCTLFYGHLSFSVFFQFLPIPCSLFSFSIPGISVNSVVSTKFRMPLRSPVSSRIFSKIYRLFSNTLLILRNQSVRQSILPRQL